MGNEFISRNSSRANFFWKILCIPTGFHCTLLLLHMYLTRMQAHSSLSQLFVKFLESESSRTTHSTPPSTPTIPGYINPHTDPDRPSLATAPLLSPNPNLTQPGHSSPAPQGKLKDAGLHHGSPSEGKLKDGGPPSQSKLKDTGPQSQPKDSTHKQSVLSTPQSSSFQSSLLKRDYGLYPRPSAPRETDRAGPRIRCGDPSDQRW